MKTRTMTRTQAELLLAAVIIARSTSYVLTKVGLQDMGKFTLLAVRFLLAFAFLAVLFWRRLLHIDRRTLLSGLAIGGIYFCVMTAELTALKTVETSTVSFVTNTAVVIVPIVQAVLSRRWPERRALIGAGLSAGRGAAHAAQRPFVHTGRRILHFGGVFVFGCHSRDRPAHARRGRSAAVRCCAGGVFGAVGVGGVFSF